MSPLAPLFDVLVLNMDIPIDEVVEQLNAFQPTQMTGYVTTMVILAEEQLKGTLNISPKAIMASAEPMDPVSRERIEEAFGLDPVSTYASTEHLVMGFNTRAYDGMYLLEDDLIFELHEDHCCITNLLNRTTPLVRYRMGDILTLVEDSVGAYPFTKVKSIVGRVEVSPVLTDPNGNDQFLMSPLVIILQFKHVEKFQFQMQSKTDFNVAYVPEKNLGGGPRS